MNHAVLETALLRSIQRKLKEILPTGTKVVNVDDYPSLTNELKNVNAFVAYSLGDGPSFPKLARDVAIYVFVDNDPGSLNMNALLGLLVSELKHGSSLALYDADLLETQLVVINPVLRGITFEVDHFRSKSIELTLKGVVT